MGTSTKRDMSGYYVNKALTTKKPLDAIHAGCWMCRQGQSPSGCPLPECIYFPFRNGHNPYSGHADPEYRKKASDRMTSVEAWRKRRNYRATD